MLRHIANCSSDLTPTLIWKSGQARPFPADALFIFYLNEYARPYKDVKQRERIGVRSIDFSLYRWNTFTSGRLHDAKQSQ